MEYPIAATSVLTAGSGSILQYDWGDDSDEIVVGAADSQGDVWFFY
jgi:hypothetical protein